MATIKINSFSAGAGLAPGSNSQAPSLAQTLRDVADDLATVKTAFNSHRTAYLATLAKLDADAGVTDVNYAATNPGPGAIGALLTLKG